MRNVRNGLWLALLLSAVAARADAQSEGGPLPLAEINFDMWCQENQHLPPDRCDKRLPQDDQAYQEFVAKFEKYEIPYLERRQDDENLNRVILHGDPIDHPTEPSAPQTNQPAYDSTPTH
jgi:hypothetical protein